MTEEEKELWAKYGQLAWQKDQTIMQTQSIVQQMLQTREQIAQLKTKKENNEK